MKVIKILFIISITMALTLTLTMKNIDEPSLKSANQHFDEEKPVAVKRTVSRFLAEKERNPRAADHCKKDNEICKILEGKNSKCCNNKCMDLDYDKHNCGACKKKCLYTEVCCRGECVNLSFDKRHCGECNNKCMHGGYCIYGTCDYA
ncbi:Stigma-specific STIG1-like protein 3 [Forsythia ovata]|uniref:Stigma-specific STIG1-like protein 3 n=1 Tax=Forsythia ovata TaxID=205694 RepID=A0ABD1R3F4_9LAMI